MCLVASALQSICQKYEIKCPGRISSCSDGGQGMKEVLDVLGILYRY